MSLTIEDGTDVPGADSYASTADLVQYCTDFARTAMPSGSQEAYLRRAASAMQSMRWKGNETYTDQSLVWPRAFVFVRSIYTPLANNEIPLDVKRGQMQLALDLYAVDTNPVFDAGAAGRITSITETVTGAVSRSKSYDNTGRSNPPSPTAASDEFFAPYLASGGNLALTRA